MDDGIQTRRRWWGGFEVGASQTCYWRIGPLELWLARSATEWRMGRRSIPGEDAVLDPRLRVAELVEGGIPDGLDAIERFALKEHDGRVHLRPALADRPLITRPQEPFTVLPRQEVHLFVSSPVWVQMGFGELPGATREFPTYRPSDTWFGPSPRIGDLCYASRTHCRRTLDDVPIRPHRAVTALRLRNDVGEPLQIERLSVPVVNLSLFVGAHGSLWTERLSITRRSAHEGVARLEIASSPPPEAKAHARISEPRRPHQADGLFRAFSALL